MLGRINAPSLPAKERTNSFCEVIKSYNLQQAVAEASRCVFCYDAPCRKGCPANIDIPKFINRIRTEDIKGAINVIMENNIFAGVCGRICPVDELCEKTCVINQLSGAVAIGHLQRFAADFCVEKSIEIDSLERNSRRVAIVGAGPAGLAAAVELKKRGYEVEIFERRQSAGGLLFFAIPTYRLPKESALFEIEFAKSIGVKVHTCRDIKKVEKFLDEGFDAVFIGIGLCKSAMLKIPGTQFEWVYSGIEFLESIASGQSIDLSGKKIGVLGGGDVAVDVARSALRLGAKSVYIVYRRSFEEMPASKDQLTQAKEEGVKIILLSTPIKIFKDEKVKGCQFIRTKLTKVNKTGRKKPIPIPKSEFILDLDVVVIAIGQNIEEEFMRHNPHIDVSKGLIVINKKTMMTSRQGIFAGGDIISGGATVVQAVAEGKKAAIGIDEYLSLALKEKRGY